MFIPKSLIHSEFDENVIERIVNSQKKLLKQGKPLKKIFLFMDDVGYDSKKIFSSKIIKNLFFNGRHYSIGLMLIMQYCIDVPTRARSNIDVTISLKEQILVNREKLFKNFFGAFANQNSFNQAMDVLTENYKALVCANNLSQSNELTDTIFWYKARHGLTNSCWERGWCKNWIVPATKIENLFWRNNANGKKSGRSKRTLNEWFPPTRMA